MQVPPASFLADPSSQASSLARWLLDFASRAENRGALAHWIVFLAAALIVYQSRLGAWRSLLGPEADDMHVH